MIFLVLLPYLFSELSTTLWNWDTQFIRIYKLYIYLTNYVKTYIKFLKCEVLNRVNYYPIIIFTFCWRNCVFLVIYEFWLTRRTQTIQGALELLFDYYDYSLWHYFNKVTRFLWMNVIPTSSKILSRQTTLNFGFVCF